MGESWRAARETLDALGVSSVTRKSKTLTFGCWGTAEGGSGASGSASTMDMVVPVSGSGASSTYAFLGACLSCSDILTDFLDCLEDLSLYRAPWYFWSSEMHDCSTRPVSHVVPMPHGSLSFERIVGSAGTYSEGGRTV